MEKDSPAVRAGLILGDRFVEMNGKRVESFEDLVAYVTFHSGDHIKFKMERMGRVFSTVITPIVTERDDGFGNQVRVGMIGVGAPVYPGNSTHLDQTYKKYIHYNFLETMEEALERTTLIVTETFFISGLIKGQGDLCQLSGPSKTIKIVWQISEEGFVSFLNFAAFISVSIGLINLFLIPLLDGEHLLPYIIEVIVGKPVPAKFRKLFSI
ncbi:RIP metalloprotease RseP [Bartonella bacilliformis Peru38]|nr:RIP metalloprotease RseP [Bartonella bacilliformis San Pedro600-02]EYS95123.1 RIP metalloprotease RseP [Bartonella bacilliformis Peru-18]KEG17795.1 RIP metalloprotease RseP [Bartonella bacilliformis CUSCO5]KEG21003.1 RIP metalloprotease RseP [Bartonella bacilliformis Peru38]KEG22697.1 RIP metalloprotease RseP [Bartonella bacilliformis Ver075]